jgi:hypothetical protein
MKRLIDGLKTRLVAALGVTAALLVPLALYGTPALARSAAAASAYEYENEDSGSAQYEYDHEHSGSAQYEYEVHDCNRTDSKNRNHRSMLTAVHSPAASAQLRHGSVLSRSSHCPRSTGDDGKDAQGSDHGKSGGDKSRGHRK